ncbi:MAG: hypothetical protein A2Y55_01640 [Actinobacteria bacterium RBG_16_68_12]|nr:MAG: hypothetical protein A2Y55_01640 [Actinobacteria bacterium RBG_16_68_12]
MVPDAWHNSLSATSNALQLDDLRDQGILAELKLSHSSKRLDVLVTGSNANTGSDSAVIVELKQWTRASVPTSPTA